MAKCGTCAHCDYLHEYETFFCSAAQHPIADKYVNDEEAECGFYEEYAEEDIDI